MGGRPSLRQGPIAKHSGLDPLNLVVVEPLSELFEGMLPDIGRIELNVRWGSVRHGKGLSPCARTQVEDSLAGL